MPHKTSTPPAGATNAPSLGFHGHIDSPKEDEVHENEWYRQFHPDYSVAETPLHTPSGVHIIIVGAGAAGLNIAYKAARQFAPGEVTFSIYEKNEDVGGTWLENRYPGCACDIPSHAYQWTYAPKPDWSSYYAGSEEIWQYIKTWAVENDLLEKVKFGHKVTRAEWDEDEGIWKVQGVDRDGKPFTDEGSVLASCHGLLNTWKYPDIPGIKTFRGKLMHSASWDQEYDLEGKTVAVVGGGSSAVQIVPAIQPKVKKLIPYLRSPIWITAGFGSKYAAPGGGNFQYSQEQKDGFRKDAAHHRQYCRELEGELNKRFLLMHLHSDDQKVSRDFVADSMRTQLGNDPRLSTHLIPQYALGCRRMTPGSDYLSSLRRPNVEVMIDSVVGVTEDSVVDASGRETKVDVIVFATGFDVTRPPYEIIGRNGRNLGEEWAEFPKGYLSIMAEGFPNMFYYIGPNGPASHGSILPIVEWHTRWMFKVISHMQRTSIKALAPSRRAVDDLQIHTHELLKRTAWSSACSSWFKNGKKHGPVTAIWPGSRLHYFEVMKEPRFEDFDIEYFGNRFAYMGNGFTSTELSENGTAVWYFDILEREQAKGTTAFWDIEA
ncbi:hypothetical protein A1O3_06518 [Capronia epimyces CBS 606.96]|uniref:Cyclohexanone monooxygenase n=1 Tax=Capronia epimyces CBS 606.96 TaxID=1182542 RepID=W9YKB1_9EURO|nr:uncharacterized protein A1O3_06518 [Capronia epimyces CBS 606.96]EXJ82704.1 hypothetical protein A1O3_06518 [Capronia epimyces CBS 606.96]